MAKLFPTAAVQFFILISHMKIPISSHPCQHLLLLTSEDYSHFSGCEVVSHVGFYKKILFTYLRERGKEGEREGEKH